jgi:hypothetical protein
MARVPKSGICWLFSHLAQPSFYAQLAKGRHRLRHEAFFSGESGALAWYGLPVRRRSASVVPLVHDGFAGFGL